MGLHEIETMKEIYAALKEIDSNVMVYGEPWNGGTAAVKNGITSDSKDKIDEMDGVGMFNDNIRNAIKGAEFGGFQHGFVQGVYTDKDNKDLFDMVCKGLVGSTELTKFPGRSLNYVECHDNYTLFDKLAMSYLGETERVSTEGNLLADLKDATTDAITIKDVSSDKVVEISALEMVKAQNKLCAAIVFLAQGTPFINGGQEFMRTKNGDHNSYKSDDKVNAIDMSFVETNKDVYNVYKGLIALRKANSTTFGANKTTTAEKVADGVIKYTAGDFVVYFNATKKYFKIDATDYTKVVDVTSGEVVESTTLPAVVGAKNFVILKK
jgi:pullulanase